MDRQPLPPRPEQVSLRGCGWGNDPYGLRVSCRHGKPPDIGLDMVGFRCARRCLAALSRCASSQVSCFSDWLW